MVFYTFVAVSDLLCHYDTSIAQKTAGTIKVLVNGANDGGAALRARKKIGIKIVRFQLLHLRTAFNFHTSELPILEKLHHLLKCAPLNTLMRIDIFNHPFMHQHNLRLA